MKKISLFLGIVLLMLSLSSCGYKYDGSSLIGAWRPEGADENDYVVYDFYSDKKVKMTYYNYGIPYAEADCYYEVFDNNKITIASEDGYVEINEFKIKKNKLTIKGNSKINLNRYTSDYNKDKSIFGQWSDENGDVYVFSENYEGLTYNKNNETMYFAYSTKADILYFEAMMNNELILPITYRIDGNTLYLDYDGKNYATLERVENNGAL